MTGKILRALAAAPIALALAATGCSSDETESDPGPPDDGPVIALKEVAEVWPSALVRGRLTRKHDCLLIGDSVAVFPFDTRWEDSLVIFPTGETVAVNTRVRLGGGYFDVDGLTQSGIPIMPVPEVQECASRTGTTQYTWAMP